VDDPLATLTRFGRALREAGLQVGTDRIVAFTRAAALLPPQDVYWAGRATLVPRAENIPVYDHVFADFFGDEAEPDRRPDGRPRAREVAAAAPSGGDGERGATIGRLASSVERLHEKSFAELSDEELDQLARLTAVVRPAMPLRRTRRQRPARRGSLDVRKTIRRSVRTGGDPVVRALRARSTRRRRLVLLLDVSASMEPYSRALLIFAHAALRADRRWEAFCFGTRLTRITTALATRRPDEALRRAAADVFDWDGGTRIGDSLKDFLDRFGHRGMARGAVVVVCSDGLDVGDPALVADQMARLSRLAYRVVWVNPLKGDPAYEPLARGMRAALPHIDVFSAGHTLASLEALGEELRALG
jgi:uncharacterized protein with von Willebrand factor type A (vWA) domain